MHKDTPFGVHLLLLQEITTWGRTYPVGSIIIASLTGLKEYPGIYHTQDGMYFYARGWGGRGVAFEIDDKMALVIDQPGYFEDYQNPTQEEIDMLVMIYPHIDKSFLMKHLKIT